MTIRKKKTANKPRPSVVRLLVRESSGNLTAVLRKALPHTLFQMEVVQTVAEFVERLQSGGTDVVLLDLSVPSIENKRSFDAIRNRYPTPPVLVYGDSDSISTMSSFLKHGAHGMFCVSDGTDTIIHAVRQAASHYQLVRENAALQDALDRRKKAIDILERLGEAMSTIFDVRKILNLTLRVVRRALDCEGCCLYLVDRDSGALIDSRDLGDNGEHPQMELWGAGGKGREHILRKAADLSLKRAEPLNLDGMDGLMDLDRSACATSDEGDLRNLLTAPLSVRGDILGVLVAVNRLGRRDFSGGDVEILESVARQTAFALSGIRTLKREQSFQEKLGDQVQLATARLQERNLELRKRLEEKGAASRKIAAMASEISEKNQSLEDMIEQFRVIHEISQVIGSELEHESLIKKIILESASLLKAETVSIMLKDTEGSLTIRHALGLSNDVIKNTRVRPGEGISGWVVEEGKPILVKDVNKIRHEASDSTLYHSDSLLCVPLKIKGKISGVLNVTNRVGGGAFDERDLFLLTILGNHAAIAIENARLYGAIRENYFNTIKALVNAVEAKDSWTKDHSENVTNYSLKIADYLGLSAEQKDIIQYAGVLHDIGKVVISSTITDKPGLLTDEEWDLMREHPLIGQRILDPIDFLEPVKVCIQTHHERCDGSGYPFGLKAHEIPLETRILSVADAFDAMVHSRPYREALSLDEAVGELKRSSGTQFDPAVVNGLVRIIEAEDASGGPEH